MRVSKTLWKNAPTRISSGAGLATINFETRSQTENGIICTKCSAKTVATVGQGAVDKLPCHAEHLHLYAGHDWQDKAQDKAE